MKRINVVRMFPRLFLRINVVCMFPRLFFVPFTFFLQHFLSFTKLVTCMSQNIYSGQHVYPTLKILILKYAEQPYVHIHT